MPGRLEFFGENARAYNSREPEVLLAGPAGTGKSVVLLTKCLTLLGKYPGCRGLFLRGTRTSLSQSGLVTWEQDVLGETHPVLTRNPCKRRVRQSYEFPNRSEFVVAGLDDPGKTLSAQYDFVYIQEATEEGVSLDAYETLLRLMRNRKMVRDGRAWHQIMMDCNPTTPAHWIYKRQEKRVLKMYESTHRDNPAFFDRTTGEFTPAGVEYIEGVLGRMTGARRARFRFGRWEAAEGLVFDGYDRKVHLLPVGWKPPADWPRVWSIDWGFTSPLVLQFWAADGDRRAYLYREQYHTGKRAESVGAWAAKEIREGREPVPHGVVCDHDPLMKAEFEGAFPYKRLELADKKDLLAGIQVVQGRFDLAGDDRPRIFFADGATVERDPKLDSSGRPASTVEELSCYIWDPKRIDDVPLDKDNHGCFVAGTLVETARGPVPIERVRPGELVRTRRGMRPVVAAGMTSPSARLATLVCANGAVLTGTPEHPVWNCATGFARLDALRYGDSVLSLQPEASWTEPPTCESSSCRPPSAWCACAFSGSCTAGTRRPSSRPTGTTSAPACPTCTRGGRTCTAICGLPFTAPFPTTTKSITRTATRSTTESRTCNCLPRPNTTRSTPQSTRSARGCASPTCRPKSAPRCCAAPPSGTDPRPGASGTPSTPGAFTPQCRLLPLPASTAVPSTPSNGTGPSGASSARTTVGPPRAASPAWTTKRASAPAGARSRATGTSEPVAAPVGVVRLLLQPDRAPVFNLTVAGEPEYFANGVLVHNCDATRYAIRYIDAHLSSGPASYETDYSAPDLPDLPADTFS